MPPQTALVERNGSELNLPMTEVRVDDVVVVRPGSKIPVDGIVVSGQATVDQATITGESIPLSAFEGTQVFAATIAIGGAMRVRAERVGADTTFGRVIRMVEEAEMHRADMQRLADRVAGWYLPVVIALAALTFLISRNLSSVVAVLVVACACSFALATPIAILASVRAAARQGLLIKGGKYPEALARADTVLIDKTGTLTLGKPRITDVVDVDGIDPDAVLALAASTERYSEHPFAEAVRAHARNRGLAVAEATAFEALPGTGVRAQVDGHSVVVGNQRSVAAAHAAVGRELEEQGKTLLFVARDQHLVGILGAADTLRAGDPRGFAGSSQAGHPAPRTVHRRQ